MKTRLYKELKAILLTFLAALFSVVALHAFVVPADFSPSGIDGACTILYEITGLNMGWFKILINIPLMILAWKFLNKKYVLIFLESMILNQENSQPL